MINSTQPAYVAPTETEQFFRKKHTSTIAFCVGVLLFFLPFAEVRCNDFPLASNTGVGLAVGKEWKAAMYTGLSEWSRNYNRGAQPLDKSKLSTGPDILTLAALITGILGIGFGFSNLKLRSMLCMSAGILAAVLLIGMMIQMHIVLKSQLGDKSTGDGESNLDMKSIIRLHFTIWYYTSVLAFIAAGFFGYRHHRIEMEDALRNNHHFDFQESQTPVV